MYNVINISRRNAKIRLGGSSQYNVERGGSSGVVVKLNASLMERCPPLFSSLLSAHQTFSKYRFWLLRGVTNRELPSGEMSIVSSKQDVSQVYRGIQDGPV